MGESDNENAAEDWNDDNIQKLEDCSSDVCGDITVTSDFDYTNLNPDCGETGTLLVIYTITDDCGNSVTKDAVFTIEDTTDPETCEPDDKTIECLGESDNENAAEDWNDDNIQKLEDCSSDVCGDITVTSDFDYTNLNPDCGETGTLLVIYTITDDCGNSVTKDAVFTIEDTTDPETCEPDDKTIECLGESDNENAAEDWNDDNIQKLEDCSSDVCGDITVTSDFDYTNLNPDCGETGTLLVIYTITDDCGNSVTKDAVFTIEDTTDPETCEPDDKTIECLGESDNENAAEDWNDDNIQKLEDCSSDICGDIEVTSNYDFDNLDPDCGETGTLTVVYTITDECDNEVTKTAVFTIVDETNPEVTCDPDDKEIECLGESSNESEANAWNAANIAKAGKLFE